MQWLDRVASATAGDQEIVCAASVRPVGTGGDGTVERGVGRSSGESPG
jgi:hypothetical protein